MVLVPVAYLLSLTDRLELVWLAFPIAEAFSLAVTLGLFVRIYRRKLKPLQR